MRWADNRLQIRPWHLVVAGLILLAESQAAGAPQADDQKPGAAQPARTDFYGDPLPPGAVARLGTLRDNISLVSGNIVLSPDGKFVTATSGSYIIPVRLWDVATGRVLVECKELDSRNRDYGVHRAAFSPDSQLMAAADGLGTVRIGRTETGRRISEIPGNGEVEVSSMRFMPDSKNLAISYFNRAPGLYDVSSGKRARALVRGSPGFLSPLPSNDTRVLMGWESFGTPSLRDLITGREIPLLAGRRIWPRSYFYPDGRFAWLRPSVFPRAFSPDGKLLAVSGDGPTLRLWDPVSGREILQFPRRSTRPAGLIDESWESHPGVFSPDSKLLAAGDTDESVTLWSVTTGQAYRRFPHLDEGHGIVFTPDGKQLISGGRYFRYWDIARGREIRRFPKFGKVKALAFGPGGKTVATADGITIRLWEASTGQEIRQFRGHRANVDALAIAPDGKRIASQDDEATLIIWDLGTGREVRRFTDLARPLKVRLAEDLYHQIASVAFSPDGKILVAADESGARIWDTARGREIRRIRDGRGAIESLCFSPDGKSLAGIDGDSVRVWDVATGRARRSWHHPNSVAATLEPDGHALAVGDIEGVVNRWDVSTGQWIGQFHDDRKSDEPPVIRSLASPPDGSMLSAGTDDGILIWDRATGRLRERNSPHIGGVNAIAISPDGKLLASASDDRTVLLWDLTTIGKD